MSDLNKPTEEQIKEFWGKIADEVGVYAGGKHYHFRFGDEWYRGEQTSFASGIPIIDPNNLFKYAVPKLKDKLCREGKYYILRNLLRDWIEQLTGDITKDALALFWCIFSIIDKDTP